MTGATTALNSSLVGGRPERHGLCDGLERRLYQLCFPVRMFGYSSIYRSALKNQKGNENGD